MTERGRIAENSEQSEMEIVNTQTEVEGEKSVFNREMVQERKRAPAPAYSKIYKR